MQKILPIPKWFEFSSETEFGFIDIVDLGNPFYGNRSVFGKVFDSKNHVPNNLNNSFPINKSEISSKKFDEANETCVQSTRIYSRINTYLQTRSTQPPWIIENLINNLFFSRFVDKKHQMIITMYNSYKTYWNYSVVLEFLYKRHTFLTLWEFTFIIEERLIQGSDSSTEHNTVEDSRNRSGSSRSSDFVLHLLTHIQNIAKNVIFKCVC